MRKLEKVAWSILAAVLANKILGIVKSPSALSGWILFFFLIAVLIIFFSGYFFYRSQENNDKIKSVLFAVLCGICFSTGIIGFSAVIWNHNYMVGLSYEIPNILLFVYLCYQIIRHYRVGISKYYKGLIIRSGILLLIFLIVISLPFQTLNIYLNRDNTILYSRGLASNYYDQSIELSKSKKYAEALDLANKAFETYKIGWENDGEDYLKIHNAFFEAYYGLMKEGNKDGDTDKVINNYNSIVKSIKIWHGEKSAENANVLRLLGQTYQKIGDYEKADSLYLKSLRICQNYYGYKNLEYALTLKHLGNSYYDQNYYTDALNAFKSAVNILTADDFKYQIGEGVDEKAAKISIDNFVAFCYSDIADIYSDKSNYDSAEVYFNKAFQVESFIDHANYPLALANYANLYIYKGEFIEAQSIITKALGITKEQYGEESYEYLNVLYKINDLNTKLSNYTEAEKGSTQAVNILTNLNAPKNNYYADFLIQYAIIKQIRGEYDRAQIVLDQALSFTNQNSSQYADILDAKSSIYVDLAEYSDAFYYSKQASDFAQKYFESDTNPYLTQYIRSEAYSNYLVGDLKYSEKLYSKCYTIDTLNKSPNQLSFAATLNGLGLVMVRKNKYVVADSLYKKSLGLYKILYGEFNANSATVLYNLAYLNYYSNKLLKSDSLFRESNRLNIKFLGASHDKIADNYVGIGKVRLKQKKQIEAMEYFNKALLIYQSKFKSDHSKIKEIRSLLVNKN